MLLTRKWLQRIVGALWLIDGLLQLQPQMFTMNMVNGVMKPMLNGQPGIFESSLQWIVQVTTSNLILINLFIAIVQILLGLGLLFGSGRLVKVTVIASIVWALIVWYGGEGMSMLFTGQSGALSGAPGAVLLYPILGLAIYPRGDGENVSDEGLISRLQLRWIFAGFWFLAALLQLQPYWWQPGQISQGISAMVGQGGLNSILVDPALQGISNATANIEIPLNIVLIVVFLALGAGIALTKPRQLRPFLIASIVVSVIIWYFSQALGMILTGMATDFNSGLLLIIFALASWPTAHAFSTARSRSSAEEKTIEHSGQLA
jgi:hypothetical protein